jgi:DNA-binding protein YbaB
MIYHQEEDILQQMQQQYSNSKSEVEFIGKGIINITIPLKEYIELVNIKEDYINNKNEKIQFQKFRNTYYRQERY